MERLNSKDRKKATDYLAIIHATGWIPTGMHHASSWHTEVLLGYAWKDNGWQIKPEILPFLEGHPLLASVVALKAQGFSVDTLRISRYRRWTISKGIPMRHTEDLRTLSVNLKGDAWQLDGPTGRWESRSLGNPGKEA